MKLGIEYEELYYPIGGYGYILPISIWGLCNGTHRIARYFVCVGVAYLEFSRY